MIRAAVLLFASASAATASPPKPCFDAPSFEAAVEALEATPWVKLPSIQALPDRAAVTFSWTSGDFDRGTARPTLKWFKPAEQARGFRGTIERVAAHADTDIAIFIRGDDALLVTQRILELGEDPALFYCTMVLWGTPGSEVRGRFGAPAFLELPDGWMESVAFEPAEIDRPQPAFPAGPVILYRITRHLWLPSDAPAEAQR